MVDAPTGTNMAAVAEERASEPDDCVMAARTSLLQAHRGKVNVLRRTPPPLHHLLLHRLLFVPSLILLPFPFHDPLCPRFFLSGLSARPEPDEYQPSALAKATTPLPGQTSSRSTWNLVSDECHRPRALAKHETFPRS